MLTHLIGRSTSSGPCFGRPRLIYRPCWPADPVVATSAAKIGALWTGAANASDWLVVPFATLPAGVADFSQHVVLGIRVGDKPGYGGRGLHVPALG